MNFTSSTLELTPQNWPSIQRLANKNAPRAQYLMGVAYLLGGLVEVDRDRAYSWFGKAALNGHADAAFRCGYLLTTGHIDKQGRDASFWYEKSAELGSAAGMVAVANLWTFRKLSQQKSWHRFFAFGDQSKGAMDALALYLRAGKEQYPAAFYFAGLHQMKGWGCPKNMAAAKELFEEGMVLRDADCAFFLAKFFGARGGEFSNLCEKAADWGHPEAQYDLALYMLRQNETTKAVSWLRRASMQKLPKAMLLLSQLHADGRGMAHSNSDAYIWARRAADSSGRSNRWLGTLYNRLTPDEKMYVASPQAMKGDAEFYSLSQTLFGDPLIPKGHNV